MISKNNLYIFIIIGSLIGFAVYLQYTIRDTTETLKKAEVQKSFTYAEKIAAYLKSEVNGDMESVLSANSTKQKSLNSVLATFTSDDIKYIFLIKKDAKGHYRFLLDGTLSNPVAYQSIFFPKSKIFDEVYESKKAQIVEQNGGVEEVWLSLLYPIVQNEKTEALLVMDLSEAYKNTIKNVNSPMKYILFWMQIFLLVSALFLFYTIYNYHTLRQTLLEDKLTKAKTKIYLREFFENKSIDIYNAILLDIDKFRYVNEKHGFEAGDHVLFLFVAEIKKHLPKEAIVIRVRGAEFFIVIPKTAADIVDISQTLYHKLSDKRYLIHNNTIALSLSMAALDLSKGTESLLDVEKILNHKLLEIKNSGKNKCVLISETIEDDLKYRNMDYIASLIEDEKLVCLYQPIQDVISGEFVKYEALVRLVDEETDTLITPNYFLDVIRDTFKYIKMSQLVLRDVLKVLHTYPNINISFNLDLYDLYNDELMDLISKELYAHKHVANRLTFEILENREIKDFSEVSIIFQKLKAYGSQIAIDDFGSGHASYIYLIKLDIDILKIDGSLILALREDPVRAKMVLRSICMLAKEQNADIIAEFVSDEELYNLVKELGIEYMQGYYIGKPQPIESYVNA